MKWSRLSGDQIKQTELIAGFGGAKLMKRLDTGELFIEGGTEQERQEALEWAEKFLGGRQKD